MKQIDHRKRSLRFFTGLFVSISALAALSSIQLDASPFHMGGMIKSTISTPPPCAGTEVGGFCWYLAAKNQSCDAVCGGAGNFNQTATQNYVNTTANIANCTAVLTALSAPTTPGGHTQDLVWNNCSQQFGCQYWDAVFVNRWGNCGDTPPPNNNANGTAAQGSVRRVCACNQ